MVIGAWGGKDGFLLSFLFLSFLFGRFAFKVKQGSKHGWVAARGGGRVRGQPEASGSLRTRQQEGHIVMRVPLVLESYANGMTTAYFYLLSVTRVLQKYSEHAQKKSPPVNIINAAASNAAASFLK